MGFLQAQSSLHLTRYLNLVSEGLGKYILYHVFIFLFEITSIVPETRRLSSSRKPMSEENTRQYKRDKTSTNPFGKPTQLHKNQRTDQGRPGSDWGLAQIEWLGIKFEWTCDISQMLSSVSEFQPDSQLQSSIVDAMGMPWEEIISDKNLDQRSLYARLAHLARIDKPLNDYDRSSTIEGPSTPTASQGRDALSPFSSPRQNQERDTPRQHVLSSPSSIPVSITPRPKRQSPWSSPLSSPPAIIKTPTPHPQQQAWKSTSVSSPTLYGKGKAGIKGIADSLLEGRGDDEVQGDPDSGSEDALDEDVRGKGKRTPHSLLPSSSTATPSSEFPSISNTQLQAEHKPEEDVKHAARGFLDELNNHFRRCISHMASHRQ